MVLYGVLSLGHFPSIFEDVWTLQADGWNKTRQLREWCTVHLKECLFLIDQIFSLESAVFRSLCRSIVRFCKFHWVDVVPINKQDQNKYS